mmetsp:Transcript_95509/g.292121  ORF Transcript_95509/g.292121 Transcript_95509/m.292121 type:complete len:343 (-) Transcript_95509:290-1318(-)
MAGRPSRAHLLRHALDERRAVGVPLLLRPGGPVLLNARQRSSTGRTSTTARMADRGSGLFGDARVVQGCHNVGAAGKVGLGLPQRSLLLDVRQTALVVRGSQAAGHAAHGRAARVGVDVRLRRLPPSSVPKLVGVAQLLEVGVLQDLSRQGPFVGIVPDEPLHDIDELGLRVRDQALDALAFLFHETEIHVGSVPLELLVQEVFGRGPQHVVDLGNLVHLVLAWKQWEQRDDLEPNATGSEEVHLEIVKAIREKALRCSVPPGADVLCIRLPGINPSATAQVGELNLVIQQEQVFWFDISVENAVPVHMVKSLQQLVNVLLDLLLRQVVSPPFDGLVQVHVH